VGLGLIELKEPGPRSYQKWVSSELYLQRRYSQHRDLCVDRFVLDSATSRASLACTNSNVLRVARPMASE